MKRILELEVFLGSDGIIRINVDGVCALRFPVDIDHFRLVVSDVGNEWAKDVFQNTVKERLQ